MSHEATSTHLDWYLARTKGGAALKLAINNQVVVKHLNMREVLSLI